MSVAIKNFENSLREYLLSAQADSYNTQTKISYRFNNLKLYMDPEKVPTPHFFVSMNISSACYSLDPLERIDGSMGAEEVYILRWASRPNINGELKKYWTYLVKSTSSNFMFETDDKGNAGIVSEENVEEVGDSVTGSGVRKTDEKNDMNKKQDK